MVSTVRRFPKTVDTDMIRNMTEGIFRSSGCCIMPQRMILSVF